MPIVAREHGFEIRIWVRGEHNPPHAHVYKAGAECRVLIGDEFTRPQILDFDRRMDNRTAKRAEDLVIKYQGECVAMWRALNGHL